MASLNVLDHAPSVLPPLPAEGVVGLYVHVPFCFHKCHYCDFYSITRQTPDRMAAFVDRLLSEARRWTERGDRFETVFVGGGTPTLLPRDDMARLFSGLRDALNLGGVTEFTVECNPATADGDYFRTMADLGVDRVSIGAQSFDPAALALLERHHDPADVPRAVDLAAEAGIGRRSVDLIHGVPGQSADDWERTVVAALTLEVEHMSCYGLTYEPNTPLDVRRRLGRVTPVDEAAELDLLARTHRRLTAAGFGRYEVSNYARPGGECRHNLGYWAGGNYLGLGPSAASHVGGVRWRNAPHLGRWERAVDAGELAVIDLDHLDANARLREAAWLGLRTADGIDLADLGRRYGIDSASRFSDVLPPLVENRLIEVEHKRVRLADAGWAVADAVAGEFLAA